MSMDREEMLKLAQKALLDSNLSNPQVCEILVAHARCDALTETAQFLLDRLDEYDPGDDEAEREYHGHVAPAIARLRSALAVPSADRGTEA